MWVSDVHLGLRHARVDRLVGFLGEHTADTLYLNGDIIDGWALSRRWYWERAYDELIRLLLSWDGSVVYVKGNHDDFLRAPYMPTSMGEIELVDDADHYCVDGRQLLVIHGDQFDPAYQRLAKLGARVRTLSPPLTRLFDRWNHRGFVENATLYARRHGYDAVICGHIHRAEINGPYMNCGDWVESSTAIVEHHDGRFEVIAC